MLSEIVSPESYVARSVNLERDLGDKTTLGQYFLTKKGLEIISRLVASLNGSKISAWSLTGPYGMGKSSFANYILSLCGPKHQKNTMLARRMLIEKDPQLLEKFNQAIADHKSISKGFFRLAATSSFQPVNHTLARGLLRSLMVDKSNKKLIKNSNKLTSKLKMLLEHDYIDTQLLTELFKEVGNIFRGPVMIIIDEFGKNLEFMSRYPSRGDLYILQSLAETENIFLWVCLHQSFEEYSAGFSTRQLQEWGKIQGRFEDISFVEPKMQMIEFIGRTLVRENNPSFIEEKIENWANYFYQKAKQLNLSEFDAINIDAFRSFYPLHPLAAIILPELCVRFAQNDRTLFAFLCGGEPNALPSFLTSQNIIPKTDTLETLGLDYLYGYFISSIQTISINRPESNRWIEINNIIENTEKLPEEEHRLLKIIGLLNLISGPLGFRASERLLSYAVFQPFADNTKFEFVKNALCNLSQRGILIYREYADEYRLWEGTDFDVASSMKEQRDRLSDQPLVEILEKTLPLIPLTASRHSYETGTLRHFERRWSDVSQLLNEAPKASLAEADGLVLYCFGNEIIQEAFPRHTKDNRPAVVAYARCEDQIKDVVMDAAAAKAILTEYPELQRDGVARKEANHRAQVAEERLKGLLSDIFNPGHPEVSWYVGNRRRKLNFHRDLSILLSKLCEDTYSGCPKVKNELINRNKLSGAAAKARRELMAAMLNNEGEENLGFEGTGPEVAMYRTMFKSSGLHQKGSDGLWKFVPPQETERDSFFQLWKKLEETVLDATDEAVKVSEIIAELIRPPFGLKRGPIPVFICYFLALKSEELALYQDNVFIPYISSEEMEMMTKRPELFTIKYFAPTGIKKKVFQFYKKLLNSQAITHDEKIRNVSMVNVVGPLVQFANQLSPYVRQTRSVGMPAQNVRNALLRAKDPIKLLFDDLPKALDLLPFEQSDFIDVDQEIVFQKSLKDALENLINADKILLEKIQNIILEAFEWKDDIVSFKNEISKQALFLIKSCRDSNLKQVLVAIAKDQDDHDEWVSSIASSAMIRPVRAWRDNDLDEFPVVMKDLANRFFSFKTIVTEQIGFIETEEKQKLRLVSITKPDGNSQKEIVMVSKEQEEKIEKIIHEMKSEYSKEDLKALLVFLGDMILSDTNK